MSMKKLFPIILFLSVALMATTVYGFNIDNFENDSSISDQDNVADAEWWTPHWPQITLSVNTDTNYTYDNSAASLKVEYDTTETYRYFGAGDLSYTGNIHDFSHNTYFSARVYGVVKLLAKFKDANDNYSGEISIEQASNSSGWSYLVWDYSDVEWGSCDATNVRDILFYPDPGYTGSGTFYLDNLTLGAESTPLSSSQKNLLLNNFNQGEDPNNFGGYGNTWYNGNAKMNCAVYFNGNEEQVRGRTGYSLQLWYDARSDDCGYYTGLNSYNLTNYSQVSFWVLGASGGEKFKVGLKDFTGNEAKVLAGDYLSGGVSKDEWRKVVIPLSAFSGVILSAMDNLSITFDAGIGSGEGMIFIDDVLFSSTMSGCPVNNFDDGAAPNATGGSEGALGVGTFAYSEDEAHSGSYSAKITPGTGGDRLVDDFDDWDLNNYFGSNNWFWPGGGIGISTVPVTGYSGGAGDKAWGMVYDANGTACGACLNLNNSNVSGYQALEFWVKGTAGGEKFAVGLKDSHDIEPKLRIDGSTYITDGNITTSWKRVSIPISAFVSSGTSINPSYDLSQAAGVSIEFNDSYGSPKSGTVCVDDIGFSPVDGGWLTLNSLDISSCDKLTFWMKGTGTEGLRVRLQGNGDSNIYPDRIQNPITVPSSWTKQEISLSNFTGIDTANMDAIHFILPKNGDTIYIDDITFEDSSNPGEPSKIESNGVEVEDKFTFNVYNMLSVTAPSYNDDPTIEGVRFEYSADGLVWYTIGTDYDVDDRTYAVGWGASDLVGRTGYILRAVAQDVSGRDSTALLSSGHSFSEAPVFVYPNPFYPYEGTQCIHFLQIPNDAVLSIYTLTGELICTLEDDGYNADEFSDDGKISWNGMNNNGAGVASGIYLYAITVDKELLDKGKFVVIK